MPLDPGALKTALEGVFASLPSSSAVAATALANAYATYAGGGSFGAAVPAIDDVRKSAMASTLAAAIATPATGSPATFANAWASAVATFWTGVPVGPAPAGATAGCPGASALTGSLTTVFANLANTTSTAAAGLSAALDTATRTVTAAVAPPPTPLTIA